MKMLQLVCACALAIVIFCMAVIVLFGHGYDVLEKRALVGAPAAISSQQVSPPPAPILTEQKSVVEMQPAPQTASPQIAPQQTSEMQSEGDRHVAWTFAHFIERNHDETFFTEADRDDCMIPAIKAGRKQTGPEWFDGFVHQHDGPMIDRLFSDGRANIMVYRCESSDGLRRYIAVPKDQCGMLDCSGADMIYLHAGKIIQTKKKSAPAADPRPVQSVECPKGTTLVIVDGRKTCLVNQVSPPPAASIVRPEPKNVPFFCTTCETGKK